MDKITELTLWYSEALDKPMTWQVGTNGVEQIINGGENRNPMFVISGKKDDKSFQLEFTGFDGLGVTLG